MATYESLIKIKGAVGDLVFYELNGKNVVRKKSGFNKTAFKKSPSYEKVRQNSSEFGHCSKVGKIIRQALDNFIKEAVDPLLYQKFAKVMTEIKDLDSLSERGKRTVRNGLFHKNGPKILREFQFGIQPNLNHILSVSKEKNYPILSLNHEVSADEIELISLKIDYENYLTEYFSEQSIIRDQKKISFQNSFPEEDLILYFAALKKDHKILNMGFL
ncbi:hypothetical protein [Chryseobacterium sp. JUb7]|uniref:hypothetical protein n=1 Tax=Chryseobacterium sp. JUb7 TaxID=2940599 RepID=UPI0021690907|nr:hypothetical protein [Chryseobacterium sp. JUb7]MCS3529087.1 hypothetical protein [Chryseobacterium sp. JUb7]